MKITKQQLRRIIRETIESNLPPELERLELEERDFANSIKSRLGAMGWYEDYDLSMELLQDKRDVIHTRRLEAGLPEKEFMYIEPPYMGRGY